MRPLTPRAARITVETANKLVVNVRAVVERLLPWLKDGISSSESSNTRTPSPDIELGDIFEFEEAAQIDLEPEQLNLHPEVEDESDEVDNEHLPTLNLEIDEDRERLLIRITLIAANERQFRVYNNLELPIPCDVFEPHPGPVQA